MTWNQTLANLRNLLATLYPAEDDARRAADDAALPDIHIQFRGSAANMWHNILKDAQRRKKVPALIHVACTDYPERATELQQLQPESPERPPHRHQNHLLCSRRSPQLPRTPSPSTAPSTLSSSASAPANSLWAAIPHRMKMLRMTSCRRTASTCPNCTSPSTR